MICDHSLGVLSVIVSGKRVSSCLLSSPTHSLMLVMLSFWLISGPTQNFRVWHPHRNLCKACVSVQHYSHIGEQTPHEQRRISFHLRNSMRVTQIQTKIFHLNQQQWSGDDQLSTSSLYEAEQQLFNKNSFQWWTFVMVVVDIVLCEVMNSSPGPTASRKLCCAIAAGCTCGPAPPPRWLKVGDAFRRVRLLPPSCCFSISHTASNCPKKKKRCCPQRKISATFLLFSQ